MSFTEKPLNALDVLNTRHVLSVGPRPRTLEGWDGARGSHSSGGGSGRASGSFAERSPGWAPTDGADAVPALRAAAPSESERCNSDPGHSQREGATTQRALARTPPALGVIEVALAPSALDLDGPARGAR